jgi:hypothetical protein
MAVGFKLESIAEVETGSPTPLSFPRLAGEPTTLPKNCSRSLP